MKKVHWLSAGMIFLFPFFLNAQHLFFCEHYSESGIPENISNRWTVNEGGGYIYFLYDFGKGNDSIEKAVTSIPPEISFYIDQKKKEEFQEFDVRTVKTDSSKNFSVLDYNFAEEGEYRITVMDEKQIDLASEILTVSMMEHKVGPGYYKGIGAIFCKEIENGIPLDTLDSIQMPPSGEAFFKVLLQQSKPLQTFKIFVDVWTMKNGKLDEFLETLFADCEEKENAVEFDYTALSTGDYRLMIYNDEQVYITSANIRVSPR